MRQLVSIVVVGGLVAPVHLCTFAVNGNNELIATRRAEWTEGKDGSSVSAVHARSFAMIKRSIDMQISPSERRQPREIGRWPHYRGVTTEQQRRGIIASVSLTDGRYPTPCWPSSSSVHTTRVHGRVHWPCPLTVNTGVQNDARVHSP